MLDITFSEFRDGRSEDIREDSCNACLSSKYPERTSLFSLMCFVTGRGSFVGSGGRQDGAR